MSCEKPTVPFCAWCFDPEHPDPAHHPGGQVRHDVHVDAIAERRFAILWVTTGDFYELMTNVALGRCWLPRFKDLPTGAQVVGGNYDFARGALGVCLAHPSFAGVPPGEQIPFLEPTVEVWRAAEVAPPAPAEAPP